MHSATLHIHVASTEEVQRIYLIDDHQRKSHFLQPSFSTSHVIVRIVFRTLVSVDVAHADVSYRIWYRKL